MRGLGETRVDFQHLPEDLPNKFDNARKRFGLTMVQSMREEMPVETHHSTRKLTYADYLQFPDDDLRHEIIGGEHYVTPSPVTQHQRISRELLYLLMQYLKAHPIGEVFGAPFDVLLSNVDIVVPDLIYVSNERAHFLTSKNLQGPPDLVVEILSPGTKRRDLGIKRDLYERVGVREYWVVDPDREVLTSYGRRAADAIFNQPEEFSKAAGAVVKSALFPGLEISLDQVLQH
jgi:Uma2 family endonuclease